MKIENIKTRKQFYSFADVWYKRAHKLREIWQDENQSSEKKEKAFILWHKMTQRVLKLTQVAIKINQPKPPSFKRGGTDIL
tara:strand:+ start:245 stop:487 length:243 start_codon:yes stop_codon:yes gene_type:complete